MEQSLLVHCDLCGQSYENGQVWCEHINQGQHLETIARVETQETKPDDSLTTDDVYPCLECGKIYKSKYGMARHVKIKHSYGNGFNCKICSQTFATKLLLREHLAQTHPDDPNLIKCSVCNKIFEDKATLSQHFKLHQTDRPFKCNVCDKAYKDKQDLVYHEKTHLPTPEHVCEQCGKSFLRKRNLRLHVKTHSDVKSFHCDVCNRTFRTNVHLRAHTRHHKPFVKALSLERHVKRLHLGIRQQMNGSKAVENGSEENEKTNEEQELEQSSMAESQGGKDQQNVSTLSASKTLKMSKRKQRCDRTVRPFSCDQCLQSFRRAQDIKRHVDRVHKPFKCEHCRKHFSLESELESHTPVCKKPAAEFQCSECGNTFASKANLRRHMGAHSGAEPKRCQQCGKTFRDEKLLKKHQLVHSDKREFACGKCYKAFRRAEDLVNHTRTHTGEAPYKCRYCNRAFKQGGNCRRHEQTHTHEKPFKCEICNRSFSTSYKVKEHQLTHQVPDGKYFKCHICQKGFSYAKSLKWHVNHVHVNPKYGCSLCSVKFPSRREAKKHEKTHQGGSVGLDVTMDEGGVGVVEGVEGSVEWQEGEVADSGVEMAVDGGGVDGEGVDGGGVDGEGVDGQGVDEEGVDEEGVDGEGSSVGWQEGTIADSGVAEVDVSEGVGGGFEQHGVTEGENGEVSGVGLDGSVGQVQHLLCEVKREMGSNDNGDSGEVGESVEGVVQSIVMTYIDGVIENDDVRGKDGDMTEGNVGDSGLEKNRGEPRGRVMGQVPKGRKTQTYKRAKQGRGSRKRRKQNKGTGGNDGGQNRVGLQSEEVRTVDEEELNNEMEQNNERTNDVEERQVNEGPHDDQVHESHESIEIEETQPVVRVKCGVSQASERNEIPGRQAKRVIERSSSKKQINGNASEKSKGRHDGQILGGKRKNPEGLNKQNKVVDRRETATSDVTVREDIEANDVRVQSKRRVVRAVGNTNIANIGATSDLIITKVIRANSDSGTRNDEKSMENSRTRVSEEQKNESQVTTNTTEVARKDVVAYSDSREDGGSISEERDNRNTTYVDIRNDNVRNSDATKNQESRGTDTSRNEASNEAIRKILEGKPFICPVCDKGHASRNGLKRHYKIHQNSIENKTPLYYCHECKKGFKTKKKFWLHDVKVHRLLETSSDESDSGHEERTIKGTCTNVMSAGDTRGDGMATRGPGEGQMHALGVAEGDLSTCKDDSVIDVDYVDGRKVKQSKITDWFH